MQKLPKQLKIQFGKFLFDTELVNIKLNENQSLISVKQQIELLFEPYKAPNSYQAVFKHLKLIYHRCHAAFVSCYNWLIE